MKPIRPNFFIIGAPKAGTTSLFSLLAAHPQAAMAQGKEPHFFSHEKKYTHSTGWQKYSQLFSHGFNKKAIGDASTSYSRIRYYPATVARIHEHVPEARIIYMVRHPLQRMESAYVGRLGSEGGHLLASVNEAVRQNPIIVDSSRYWEVFEAYRQKFDELRIKIVWFEEYIARQTAVFQEVCRFLDIDDSVRPALDREMTNSRAFASERMAKRGLPSVKVDTAWDDATRKWVVDQLREDNCRFLAYFGRPTNYWADLY